jgi:hypothetical protein
MRATSCLAVMLLVMTPPATPAQTLDSARDMALQPWSKLDSWPPGERLVVTLKTGELIRGTFVRSNEEALVLGDETGRERTVRKVDVLRALGEKRDTTVDGLLIGAAIGAGAGVLKGYDKRTFECRAGCSIAIGTTLFTPVGALVGWLRDRHMSHSEVLYEAPP